MRAKLRLSQVAPGVVLDLDGDERRVIGTLYFDMPGTRWREHSVETDTGPPEWVSVRPRGGTVIVVWTPRNDLVGEPDRSGVTMDGREWTLAATGSATYTATGDTGTGSTGSCDFVEFSDADGLLVFESFDGGVWEISVGRLVDAARVRGYREVVAD
jgi:hypothetical protein